MKPIDPLPVFQAISVLAAEPVILRRSGVAVILGVPLICRLSVLVSPRCSRPAARHCDPKLTASPSTSAENTKGRLAASQDLRVVNNDEVLLGILFTMEKTLNLQVQSPPVTFQRAV